MKLFRRSRGTQWQTLVLWGLATLLAPGAERAMVSSRGAVATVHPLATQAGMKALEQGGNAIDAAVTAALMLGVVDGHNSGLGGGCFILLRTAGGEVVAIDARETAPALATPDMYLLPTPDGKPAVDQRASKTGARAVATPGALAGYALALEQHGKLPLSQAAAPSIHVAEQGFALDAVYARRLDASREELVLFPATKSLLFKEDGRPLQKGDTLRQPDLATTLRAIAQDGVRAYYEGEFATRVGDWMLANGGVLRRGDLAAYQPKLRQAIHSTYRGYEIIGFPPPSSGGVHVAQILNMLEPFPMATLAEADRLHVLAEAMKAAFADRAHWLGDPDFVRVPRGLLNKDYARSLASRITPGGAACTLLQHGTPPQADTDVFGGLRKHTTHLCAADAQGNWVAITQTINTAFGSKVIVPGTGVILNNEMDDFAAAPQVPNAFGLVGSEANAPGPRKRPLSSMSPTLVLKNGQPFLAVGGAGGPTIISQTVQHLVAVLDLKQSMTDALGSPRLHHQWAPDELRMESAFGGPLIDAMKQRGHAVREAGSPGIGVSQGLRRDEANGAWEAAADPRLPQD